ncbi:hypothetical protein [Streptomyces prasinus]|uniref:hypothetical protein n=1 Tax=Streptomyces prasinus TaxID=67345 RepID=UPI0033BBB40A
MYKVFDAEETEVWREWIRSLGEEPAEPRDYSPLEAILLLADAVRTRPGGWLSDSRTLVGPQPGNPDRLVERPVSWWCLQPAPALLAALTHPANTADGTGGDGLSTAATDLLHEFFGPADAARLARDLPVSRTVRQIMHDWVEVGCPLPDTGAPDMRVSLSTTQPVPEPDSPLRLRIQGMGSIH